METAMVGQRISIYTSIHLDWSIRTSSHEPRFPARSQFPPSAAFQRALAPLTPGHGLRDAAQT